MRRAGRDITLPKSGFYAMLDPMYISCQLWTRLVSGQSKTNDWTQLYSHWPPSCQPNVSWFEVSIPIFSITGGLIQGVKPCCPHVQTPHGVKRPDTPGNSRRGNQHLRSARAPDKRDVEANAKAKTTRCRAVFVAKRTTACIPVRATVNETPDHIIPRPRDVVLTQWCMMTSQRLLLLKFHDRMMRQFVSKALLESR